MTGPGPNTDRTGPGVQPRTTLSPREAARLIQVGRSSIMRAIASGDLPARRDNRNQWQIELETLERWCAGRSDHDRSVSTDHDRPAARTSPDHLSTFARELAEARAQVADMRSQNAQLQVRLEERAALVRAAEGRAQAAEALAAKLADLLAAREAPAPAAEPTAPKRWRWWSW